MAYRYRGLGRAGLGGASSPASDPLVASIDSAIAQMEGFNSSSSLAAINNNPGNLRSGAGQTGTNGGFAVFPDAATGWAALSNQTQLNINRGLTLQQFFGGLPGVYPGYAPAADSNSPNQYASFVAQQAGIPSDVPLTQLQGGTAAQSSSAPASSPVDAPGSALPDMSTLTSGIDLSSLSSIDWTNPYTIGAVALLGVGLAVWAAS